jgi:hypothetical protein
LFDAYLDNKNMRGLPAAKGVEQMSEKPENARRVERPWGISDLPADATRDISAALTGLLADVFALYLKTKNFHWQTSSRTSILS